jgi:hypothetical protein
MVRSYQEQALIIAKVLFILSTQKKVEEIENYYSAIHTEFFKLKSTHPDYFSRLLFDNNGHIPFSEDLDSIIQDFQVAGMISKKNPRFTTLIINSVATQSLIENEEIDSPHISRSELDAMVDELAL